MTTGALMQYRANTILLTRPYGGVRSMAFNPRRSLLMLSGCLLLFCGALLYVGFQLGAGSEIQRQLAEVSQLQQQARQQQDDLNHTQTLARDNLDALALRLGRMQAQMLRLDTLGQRLVDQAQLDGDEFDFSQPPPVGGPESADSDSENRVPDFIAALDSLHDEITDRARKLSMLERLLMFRDLNARVIPSGLPVAHGLQSSGFGTRIDPFTGKQEQHNGIDIAGKAGSTVVAIADGIVIWSGARSGYGNLVEIDHGNGYITRYGHNQRLLAHTGDKVHKGDAIALLGSTGRSTGPHVHIEVLHHGKAVNPFRFLHPTAAH
jgi:murein DD-endopeptidase MepM/ murein hydrolase activator NlpD